MKNCWHKMLSLQDKYGENGICFGCGPKNDKGLQIKSYPEGEHYICKYTPKKEHQALEGVINGGIIGSIFDCHGNWSAAHALFKLDPEKPFPSTVTITFTVNLTVCANVFRRVHPKGLPFKARRQQWYRSPKCFT